MSVDEKAQVLQKVESYPQAPSARFCQRLEYPRATATVGETDRDWEALRIKGIQAHLGAT